MTSVAGFWPGSAAALASVLFGGMVFSTRFVIAETDPVMLAFLRFGMGALCMAPMLLGPRRPVLRSADLGGAAGLGVLLFAVMPVLLAAGLRLTYASRGALVLAVQPLLTLLLARWRGEERLSAAKLSGIALAAGGLWLALGGEAPQPGGSTSARLGDLMLLLAALCVAVYNVYSRPYLERCTAIGFTALTMTAGALALAPLAAGLTLSRGWPSFTPLGWAAVLYIGTFGAAVGYSLWVWALERTTPTRVSLFLALNPLTATLLGAAFLEEPLTGRFLAGFLAVLLGLGLGSGAPEPSFRTPRL